MVNKLGVQGENVVAQYLADNGWTLVERNWRCRYGEVDIIAQDPAGTLVFVEVKARSGTGYGHPLEAITHAKLARLRQLTAHWLHDHPKQAPSQVRIDACAVMWQPGKAPRISHLQGVA